MTVPTDRPATAAELQNATDETTGQDLQSLSGQRLHNAPSSSGI